MRQILIGITCNYLAEVPDAFHAGIGAKEQAWQLIAQDYLDAVWKAGGIPVLIPIDKEADRACGILNTIDGLIISGGNDVSPSLYGERVTCCERSGTGTRGFRKDGGRNRRGCGITGKEICGCGSMASGNDV